MFVLSVVYYFSSASCIASVGRSADMEGGSLEALFLVVLEEGRKEGRKGVGEGE